MKSRITMVHVYINENTPCSPSGELYSSIDPREVLNPLLHMCVSHCRCTSTERGEYGGEIAQSRIVLESRLYTLTSPSDRDPRTILAGKYTTRTFSC